jgi:hypothetical protein
MMNAPKWLTWVGIIALLWNLMGLAAVASDTFGGGAGLTEAQRAFGEAMPLWAVAASWTAVVTGVLGCIALIRKRRWAGGLLALSLLAVIGQYIYLVVLTDAKAVFGDMIPILQTAVLVIALALMLLARHAARKGWLA